MSDVNEGLYDVIFDDDALGEEESIDISRVILLASVRSCGSIEQCAEGEEVTIQHFILETLHFLLHSLPYTFYIILYTSH